MKKFYIKQLIAIILLLCSMAASAETYSGSCGENANWSLDTETGVLEITGTGAMTDYGSSSYLPWNNYSDSITSVTVGDGITSIGILAFSGCSAIISIEIPNSVTAIGISAFKGCSSLASIEIPNSVTSIGAGAFGRCKNLASIEIPNSVTTIGNEAFYSCSGLTSIEIPNSVTTIGANAFNGCTGIASAVIGNSVTTIGNSAFKGCSGLTSVTIGNSVTTIEPYAFIHCTSLTSIEIPNSVTNIENYAFYYCSGLTSVKIGKSVTRIGVAAFCGCSSLTSIEIPNGVTKIEDSTFANCSSLTSATIGNSVKTIGKQAFYYCKSLTDIYFASNPSIAYTTAIPTTATRHLRITDSDAADFNTANERTYADASYTRAISEGKYGTIMLPFTPDAASLQNYAFYTLKEAGDGFMKFEEVAAPVANTPYLYTLRAGGENTAITGGRTTIAADIANSTAGNWESVGSFSNQSIDCTTGNYYAYSATRNEINRITKTLTVRPFRAYFKSSAAQDSNLRVFIGGTTGVTEISPDDIDGFNGGAIYDLNGRRVNEPSKGGIYIVNGKKVLL